MEERVLGRNHDVGPASARYTGTVRRRAGESDYSPVSTRQTFFFILEYNLSSQPTTVKCY